MSSGYYSVLTSYVLWAFVCMFYLKPVIISLFYLDKQELYSMANMKFKLNEML